MSRSKKLAKGSEPTPLTCFFPVCSPDFKADLRWWYLQEPKKADRIMDLVAVATCNHNRVGPQSSQFWDQIKCNYPVV